MEYPRALRDQLARMLDWEEAHGSLEQAVAGIPDGQWATIPESLPYSCWQLLWHIWFTQHDILDFCLNPEYEEHPWPKGYWPSRLPRDGEWKDILESFRQDRQRLQELARDPAIDLLATIPHGAGQTYLREILLTADHTAYHMGQIVVVRRCLGIWPDG